MARLAKNSNRTDAAWLLEHKHPDEHSQNRHQANELAESAPRIVLGVNIGVAAFDEDSSPASEG